MHEAYEVIPIVQKLPPGLSIESISAYDDYLLVGTKSGTLLYYQLVPAPKAASKPGSIHYDVKLLRSNKSFSKKAIVQLQVVPEFQMLICLAEGTVAAFDLSQCSLTPIAVLQKTKGAHFFTISVNKHKNLDGEVYPSLTLCVAVKKKLQLFYWKPKILKFLEFSDDLLLRDIPRTIVWCGESLCVGYKSEYSLMKISGETKDLFPTGGNQLEPLVSLLPDEKLAVGSDEQTILIDSDGNPTMKYSIKWSEVPLALVYDEPYLIAVLPSAVEVRPIEPRIHVQSIDLPKAKMIVTSKQGWVFAASNSDVWLLHAVNFPEQITQLLSQKQFDLALRMAEMTPDSEIEKKQIVQRINNLNAFYLFCKQNFKDAMEQFIKLETDPSHVIGLFPNLLPEEFRSSLEYPDRLPNLQGTELEDGLVALTNYLVEIRSRLLSDSNSSVPSMTAIMEPGKTKFRSKKQLLQIIDTTLLKCYLQTNDGLVASLLRMKENYCHIDESERALKLHQKYRELLILYNKKGMHRKALELLMRHAKKPDSSLRGHEKTIQYLQDLGAEHLELIFEFAKWVLKEHPEDGLKIFAEEMTETEHLPRSLVLQYLCETEPDLVIPYLEFIICKWDEENNLFHNTLVNKYCEKILVLLNDYRNALPEGHSPAPAGQEPGELGVLRKKLLLFLEGSEHCTVERFATYMMNKGLYDEGAVILGKLGRHDDALTIYIHILQNYSKAERYCEKHYHKDKPGNQDVYLVLLKLYLPSAENQKINIPAVGYVPIPKPNIERAISILKQYSNKIDSFKALSLLPSVISVSDVKTFLECVLHSIQSQKYDVQLTKSLLYAEHLQVKAKSIHFHSYKLTVTDLDMCRVCQKRIGKSAFAHFPTGVTVHYSCKDQYSAEN
ncbi:vam6/Vps39-like protein isoform X1 [Parasteatoda tepidariorum]|uniref:vam6/Vps39-like protein isoform X1 n=1 Tax=Parasteatoda tepidariorum TaxID=114398 RepID=UPI00077FADED|nr:vam6/Vps39-like protein [Parasteatoda tepidariorum]